MYFKFPWKVIIVFVEWENVIVNHSKNMLGEINPLYSHCNKNVNLNKEAKTEH